MSDLALMLEESYPQSVRTAYLILGNRPDAEDAVQEAFLRAWKFRNSLAKETSVRPGCIASSSIPVTRSYARTSLDASAATRPRSRHHAHRRRSRRSICRHQRRHSRLEGLTRSSAHRHRSSLLRRVERTRDCHRHRPQARHREVPSSRRSSPLAVTLRCARTRRPRQ